MCVCVERGLVGMGGNENENLFFCRLCVCVFHMRFFFLVFFFVYFFFFLPVCIFERGVSMIRTEVVTPDEFASSDDSTRITPVQERRSSAYLTKYETARVLGERARQIVSGTSVLMHSRDCHAERDALELAERCSDPYSASVDPIFIAKKDLLQGKIPMIVRRTWPDGRTENIPLSELLIDKAMLNIQS